MKLRTHWRNDDKFLIRHRDRALIVVEKKAGLLTHGRPSDRGKSRDTLLSLLRSIPGEKRSIVLPVHRLDRPVSGLLVFARTPRAREGLIEQFRTKTVERRYIAAVRGELTSAQGTFRSWLKTDDPSLRVYSDSSSDGKSRMAVTHWKKLELLRGATLVEVRLETGLKNQIRVHFSEAGHPLLGEKLYDQEAQEGRRFRGQRGERIFLHAAVLGFRHPVTNKFLRFEAPLPTDLSGWLRRLRPKAQRMD